MSSFPYASADDFHLSCQEHFRQSAEELQWHYPVAKISHLCVRTANEHDFEKIAAYGTALGTVTINVHKSEKILFIKLNDPLTDGALRADYIEVTSPKEKYPFTDAQALICVDPRVKEPLFYQTQQINGFMFRCQQKSAADIVASTLAP